MNPVTVTTLSWILVMRKMCKLCDVRSTPKQIGPRPNQTKICFTFVSNPPVSWGSCRVLSQLDKCTAASAALNGQSEIETEPTRVVHLTFNPSHKTLLVLLYSISPCEILVLFYLNCSKSKSHCIKFKTHIQSKLISWRHYINSGAKSAASPCPTQLGPALSLLTAAPPETRS